MSSLEKEYPTGLENEITNSTKECQTIPMLSLRYLPFESVCGFTNPYFGENQGLSEEELKYHTNHMRSVGDALHFFYRIHPALLNNGAISAHPYSADGQSTPLVSPAVSASKDRKQVENIESIPHPNLCTTQNRMIHPNLVHSINQRWQLRVHLLNNNMSVFNLADLSHPYVSEMVGAPSKILKTENKEYTE
ncbi:hypothetical protein cand_014460 [Cryptosporidium andersoni]|uniref:Uncharacterized protein n=1 Tax=Cryptosporidium andersoni TaxID=117008 RepID=A0A1J4MTY5_9CRYT|nr:hypothetical protein cand_014460 [Cryptosporidium andersoni]